MSSSSGSHILYVKDLKNATTASKAASMKEELDEIEILEPSSVIQVRLKYL